jgi:hypothetical protein
MSSDAEPNIVPQEPVSHTDATPVNPSSPDSAVTEPEIQPMPPEPAVYVRLIFENVVEEDRERCEGNFPLADIYDKEFMMVRCSRFSTVHQYIHAIAADQLSEILPAASFPAAQRTAFSTHTRSLQIELNYGKNRTSLAFRNCDVQLHRFLGKLKLNPSIELIMSVNHPDVPTTLRFRNNLPAAHAAEAPAVPSTPASTSSTGSAASSGDDSNVPSDASMKEPDGTDNTNDNGNDDTDDSNGKVPATPNGPNPGSQSNGDPAPPRPHRFADADPSPGSRGLFPKTPDYLNRAASQPTSPLDSDATDYTPVPDDMVAKVYVTPNAANTSADQTAVAHQSSYVRSYTIYVPRSIPEMPPVYNSFDFVPEQRKYLLLNNFRVDNVSKWELPAFPAEDTALNWYEALTIYAMGLGIFIPPYGSLEHGNPMGKLWHLVSREIPYAKDLKTTWSNALYALLSKAINGTTASLNCARPSRTEARAILMRNNGNGYKVLYDLMQFHATQLNIGTSSRIRNEGPPVFGKSKSIDEFLGRYKEYWVQRYYYSTNRTVCLSPELQLNFMDRLPREIKLAFNMYYWRPHYDSAPPEFWGYDTIPDALMFHNIAEYVGMACERQDMNIESLLGRSLGGKAHATAGIESQDNHMDPFDGDLDMDFAQVCAVTGARDQGPTGQCSFCPNHQGRHDIKSCFFLARLVAGLRCLKANPALHQHFDGLFPGHLKNLPPPPPRPPGRDSRDSGRSSGKRPSGSSNAKKGGRSAAPKSSTVHATQGTESDDESAAPDETPEAGEGNPTDNGGTVRACQADQYQTDFFDHFDSLAGMDFGSVRALSNQPFPRFAVEDADNFVPTEEFPDPDVLDCSYTDVDYLLHPYECSVEDDLGSDVGAAVCRMTRGQCHSTGRRSTAPWASPAERYLWAHMDHGANLSVVYDARVLHRFVSRRGIVIHDVGDNRHPTLGYGFLCLYSVSHEAPIYIPAYYCPSLASNIISPGQFAKFARGRHSATVLDHDEGTGHMRVVNPADTHDIVVNGVLHEHLLWAGPLIPPPEELALQTVCQPWSSLGPKLCDAPPILSGTGEGDSPNVVQMARTRSASARVVAPPQSPDPALAAATAARATDLPVPAAVPTQSVPSPTPTPDDVDVDPVPTGVVRNDTRTCPADLEERRVYIRALLHQRLGHLHQRRLSDLHRFVLGVPKSLGTSALACECAVCLAAKMRRSPAGHGLTRQAEVPFAGLSMDLGFVVQRPDRQKITRADQSSPSKTSLVPISADAFARLSPWHKYKYQLGIGGEVGYIVIQDHFTGALFGTTLVNKSPPIDYIRSFLERHPARR